MYFRTRKIKGLWESPLLCRLFLTFFISSRTTASAALIALQGASLYWEMLNYANLHAYCVFKERITLTSKWMRRGNVTVVIKNHSFRRQVDIYTQNKFLMTQLSAVQTLSNLLWLMSLDLSTVQSAYACQVLRKYRSSTSKTRHHWRYHSLWPSLGMRGKHEVVALTLIW